jgi:hypothetical protein
VLVAANAVSKQDYDNAVASQGQAAADVANGQGGGRNGADQPGLYQRRVAHQRPERRVASHGRCVRASERGDADDDRSSRSIQSMSISRNRASRVCNCAETLRQVS